MVLKRYFENLEPSLQKLQDKKTQAVFDAVKGHWPGKIHKNKLALFRLGLAAAIIIILLDFRGDALIATLFAVGMVAGYINEATPDVSEKTSSLAKMIDPFTDRALTIPVAFYLLAISSTPLLVVMILMEICNAYITISIEDGKKPSQPDIFGKSKTLFQIVGCVGLLLFWRILPLNILFITIIWSSLVLSMLSMRQKIFSISTHHARQINTAQNLQYSIEEKRII